MLQACTNSQQSTKSSEPSSIGPQFWKYDLREYEIAESDVLMGLGGRWISVRYARQDGCIRLKARFSLVLPKPWETMDGPSLRSQIIGPQEYGTNLRTTFSSDERLDLVSPEAGFTRSESM
jgi:hypothetical protein